MIGRLLWDFIMFKTIEIVMHINSQKTMKDPILQIREEIWIIRK
jgi:hypothetical protein